LTHAIEEIQGLTEAFVNPERSSLERYAQELETLRVERSPNAGR
jgi:hypothetical protein